MGLTVLRTPVRSPQANAFCERVIGTIRRECLDWMILLNERHLRQVLREWAAHYNRGRPHASLGPGIPEGVMSRRCTPKSIASWPIRFWAVFSQGLTRANGFLRWSLSFLRDPPPEVDETSEICRTLPASGRSAGHI